jgi:tetratricopeptide (TPR) repeat protein
MLVNRPNTALALALAALLLAALPAPAATAAHVLPPTAERELIRILQLEGPAPDGYALQVAIDKDRARVTASRGGAVEATLTLVHPGDAPDDAPRAAGFAVIHEAAPGDSQAVAAVMARLQATGRAVTWTELDDAPKAPGAPPGGDPKRQAEVHEQIDVALYKTALGELETARLVLAGLPADVPSGTALQIATAWRLAGSPERAEATLARLTDLDPAQTMAAAAIRGQTDLDIAAALGDTTGQAACERIAAAAILARLGLSEQALRYASAVRERAPDCARAWESELHRLLDAHRTADAAALADQAVARFPDDDQLLSLAASIFNAHGEYRKAVPILESVARRHPDQEGVMRVLLSSMLRDVEWRESYRVALQAKLDADPQDVLAQFLLGIIAHYENRFDESNALLTPIEAQVGHQSRFHIYRAMNDFNLGKVDAAIARLDQAAKRPLPDPDVFYCRAEILRDTNRQQALEDLRRYRVNPEGVTLSNPDKEVRVDRMLKDLEACIADGRPKCESEWEHPRLTHGETIPGAVDAPEPPPAVATRDPWPWVVGGALMALLVFMVIHARRRRA